MDAVNMGHPPALNSATALEPWRTPKAATSPSDDNVLQFGHGVGAVENTIGTLSIVGNSVASIRPRRWSRGERPSTR